MTTPTVTERGRLTALRAAWLFDGTGSALIADPLVVIDGGTIVAVDSGAATPGGADVIDLGGAALLPSICPSSRPNCCGPRSTRRTGTGSR